MKLRIDPVPKPRMTRSDRWKQRPAVMRYRAYCDILRELYPKKVPPRIQLTFLITMPKSWTSKKRIEMNGAPHQQTPDIDNLVKAFLDALCENDSYVYSVLAEKYWAEEGAIEVDEN